MANDELKAAAQKELLRRKAKAELARRRGAQPAPQAAIPVQPSPFGFQPQGMDAAMNKAKGLTFKDLGAFDQALGRMVVNGASFGFANKGAAGIDAMLGNGTYDENLAREYAATDQARETAGTAGAIAEIGGSMLPATKLVQMGATATRIPGAIGKYFGMGIDGAALGATSAVGNDQDIATGAMYGAAGGAAGQAVGGIASGVANKVAALRQNPQQRAAASVYSAIEDMKGSPADLQRQVQDLGPDAMMIDALGERGGALGRYASNIDPGAREMLEGALLGRKSGQNVRLADDVIIASGLPLGHSPKPLDDLKAGAYAKVKPQIDRAYDDAAAAGFDLDLAPFQSIKETPLGRNAFADALRNVRNRAFDAPQPVSNSLSPQGVTPKKPKVNYSEVNRVVNDLAPSMGPRPARPADLLDFVIAKGGVRDTGGELRAFDFHKTRKGRHAIRVNAGRDADEMREAAAEAGYFDHLYGNPSNAISQSTTADFLDALGENYAGKPVFSYNDAADVEAWKAFKEYQRTRADFRSTGRQVAEKMGRGTPASVLRDVISKVDRGVDIDEAIEGAKYADFVDNGSVPMDVPVGLNGENVRNFSNLRLLDEMKRSLDDKASTAYRAGAKNDGSVASDMAKALRGKIDESMQGPEYAAARELRSKAYRTDDAFDLGGELGRGRIPLGKSAKTGDVAPENQYALQQGYGSTLTERLLNNQATDGALNSLLTPASVDAGRAVLGSKYDDLAKAISREKTFNRSAKAVSGNSTTARQLAEMITGGGVLGLGTAAATGQDLLTGGVGGMALGITRRGGQALAQKFASSRSREMAPELAKILAQKVLPKMPDKTKAQKIIESNKDLIARLLMGGAIGASQ